MRRMPQDHPLIKLFRWSVRKSVYISSVQCSPDLESYICDEILAKFVHIDNLYMIKNSSGKKITEIAEMFLEIENVPSRDPVLRDIRFHQYIGDYVLFITGLFPESLKRIQRHQESQDYLLMTLNSIILPFDSSLDYYIEQGRTAYEKVSRLYIGRDRSKFILFIDLTNHFESYVNLMSLIRTYLEASPQFQEVKHVITG